jgi:hypothetical protein
MERMVVKTDRKKFAKAPLVCLFFLLMAITCRNIFSPFAFWAVVVGFTPALIFFTKKLFDSSPRLVIDESGLSEQLIDRIQWDDIKDITVLGNPKPMSVGIQVKDEQKYIDQIWFYRMPLIGALLLGLNKALGYPLIIIDLQGINQDVTKVCEHLLKSYEQRQSAQ